MHGRQAWNVWSRDYLQFCHCLALFSIDNNLENFEVELPFGLLAIVFRNPDDVPLVPLVANDFLDFNGTDAKPLELAKANMAVVVNRKSLSDKLKPENVIGYKLGSMELIEDLVRILPAILVGGFTAKGS